MAGICKYYRTKLLKKGLIKNVHLQRDTKIDKHFVLKIYSGVCFINLKLFFLKFSRWKSSNKLIWLFSANLKAILKIFLKYFCQNNLKLIYEPYFLFQNSTAMFIQIISKKYANFGYKSFPQYAIQSIMYLTKKNYF